MVHKIKYLFSAIGTTSTENKSLSQKLIKNIVLSFGIKSGSILIGLLLIPMTINYIDPIQYGIWLTISSIVTWMTFFDIGMGHGLRNKLTESLAKGENEKAKTYVSTTYAVISIISMVLLVSFFLVIPMVNWHKALSVPSYVKVNLTIIMLTVFGVFCVQFVVQLLNTILTALHKTAMVGLISFLGQLTLLFSVFVLKLFVLPDLMILVAVLTIFPVVVSLVASIVLYRGSLRDLKPSLSHIDFRYSKDILSIGSSFFIIQLGAIVLFQTNNIIITKVIGPEAVTQYNVAYKLFTVIIMVFTIIVTPYWSAFTEAYIKNDLAWIRRNMKLIRKVWLMLSGVTLLLLACSSFLYRLWIGDSVKINFALSATIAVYVILYMWQTAHVFFLNGTGKIRVQFYLVSCSALLNIPLAIYLGKLNGVSGVVSANIVFFVIMGIIFYLQTERIIQNKATGLWNR